MAGVPGVEDPPLAGIRVLSAEQYGAGPFASMYLADMGAEVIKIEEPRCRRQQPRVGAALPGGGTTATSSKPSTLASAASTLDLRRPKGQAILHRLVPDRGRGPEQPARRPARRSSASHTEALAPHDSRIVCAHLSGYGRTGERATWPAYDYLMQAEAGFMSVTGEPDGPMTRMGLSVVDYLTGITTAFALTAAMLGAARTGRGRDVDVTLYDVAMHQLTYPATWYLNEADPIQRRPRSGHPFVVPCEFAADR